MKNSVKTLFWFCSLIGVSMSSSAQELKVFDSETLEPVEDVAIYNSDRTHSAITGPQGTADLAAFSADDSIYFQHPTYKPIVRSRGELKELNYSLALEKRVIKLQGF